MLEILAAVPFALWLLGMATATTLGGTLHTLLVAAAAIVLVRVLQRRQPQLQKLPPAPDAAAGERP